MATATITCPSGLIGEVRGFKVKEANLLADRMALKKGTALDGVLAGCWTRTVEPGPYAFLASANDDLGARVDWQKVLLCDRFFALVQIRCATYGPEYTFKVQCQGDACREPIDWELKLTDLEFKELPEASREAIRAGTNKFPLALPDGKQAYFRLQTGASEAQAAQLSRSMQSRAVGAAIATRLVEIDGVDPNRRNRYIDELDLGDLRTILDQLDEADGGLNTTIEIECYTCGMLQEVELPFGRDFFLPRATKKSRTASPA